MEFKMIEKQMGIEYGWIAYDYTPIDSVEHGWRVIYELFGKCAKAGKMDEDGIFIKGPDDGDKEFGDIGAKYFKSRDEIIQRMDELIKDGNYSCEAMYEVGDDDVSVDMAVFRGGIQIAVFGEKKYIKKMVKAIIG